MIKNCKILVHLHLYYHNQLNYFLDKLKNLKGYDWDLYVTLVEPDDNIIQEIIKFKPEAIIFNVSNNGYDIWPFIYVLNQIDLNKYDFILKLHSKGYQQENRYNEGLGYTWRNKLVDALLQSKNQFKNNINILKKNKQIGMLGYAVHKCTVNLNCPEESTLYDECCNILGIPNIRGNFVGGTMFLCRANLMKIFQTFNLKESFFSTSEATGASCTYAHVIERLFGVLTEMQGYKISLAYKQLSLKDFIQNIFSIKNEYSAYNVKHKVIRILGLKIRMNKRKV